jgi:hippurate hydrolase
MLLEKIKSLAKQHQAENVSIRRHLHANPELSYQEFETSKYVQAQLKAIGIPFTVIATTGVLGIIEGKNPSKRVVAIWTPFLLLKKIKSIIFLLKKA